MYTLLIDLSNLWMRNAFHKEVRLTSNNPEYSLLKYFVFDQIYWSIYKLKKQDLQVDEIILCCDVKNSWRKIYFPRYKESRQKKRSEDIDWDDLFIQLEILKKDIKNFIPFKVLSVDRCEADDIIGTLCLKIPERNFIIISTDSDFKQLLNKDNVKLFDPFDKEFVKCDDVNKFLLEIVLTGQTKDDIFNIKTPANYPKELRKPGLGEKTVQKILDEGLDKFLDTEMSINKKYIDENGIEQKYQIKFFPRDNFKRNQVLIDFNLIPEIISNMIIDVYNQYVMPSGNDMYKFFQKQGWKSYLDNFEVTEKVLSKLN